MLIQNPYLLQLVPVSRIVFWRNGQGFLNGGSINFGWDADSTGTMLRESRHCPEYPKKIPTPVRRSGVGLRERQVRTRWFGQNLSEVPDSCIGHTQDNRTDRTNEVWYEPDTYQPTSSQPIGRNRRAGDQLDTRPEVDREVRREGTRWGTPHKRVLFGSDGPDSIFVW